MAANRYFKNAMMNLALCCVCLLLALTCGVLAGRHLYKHRRHELSVARAEIDRSSSVRMFLDELFETRMNRGELREDQRDEAIPTDKLGKGQYYFPGPPVYADERWTFPNTRLYYIEDFQYYINSTVAEQGRRFTLYQLPCDKPFDEIQLAMSMMLFFRALMYGYLFLHGWKQHQAFQLYQTDREVPPDNAFVRGARLALQLLMLGLVVISLLNVQMYFGSQTCERDVPDLYLVAQLHVIALFTMAAALLVRAVLRTVRSNRECAQCQGQNSRTAVLQPCGHRPEFCAQCARRLLADSECIVCRRLVRAVRETDAGKFAAFGVALVGFVQLVLPFMELQWHLWHTACFEQDPPYTVYTKGCLLGQYMGALMLLNGFVATLVAEKHGRTWLLKLHIWANYVVLGYCILQGVQFHMAASARVYEPLTKVSVQDRRRGYTFDQMRELVHHHWYGLRGDCDLDSAGSIFYQWYSCRPCDKTSPSSCRGETQYDLNHHMTVQAAIGFTLDLFASFLGLLFARALIRTNARQDRERLNRGKFEFKALLASEPAITESTAWPQRLSHGPEQADDTPGESMSLWQRLRRQVAHFASASRRAAQAYVGAAEAADGRAGEAEREEEADGDKAGWELRLRRHPHFHPTVLADSDRRALFEEHKRALGVETRKRQAAAAAAVNPARGAPGRRGGPGGARVRFAAAGRPVGKQ